MNVLALVSGIMQNKEITGKGMSWFMVSLEVL